MSKAQPPNTLLFFPLKFGGAIPSITVRDAIEALEKTGYRAFPAARVKDLRFEHKLDATPYRHDPGFREYMQRELSCLLAHQLSDIARPEMVWVEYPEDPDTRTIPVRSYMTLVVPTKEALERERDRRVEFERQQHASGTSSSGLMSWRAIGVIRAENRRRGREEPQ